MRRLIPATVVLGVLVVIIVGQAAGIGGSTPTTPATATPRWVTHVARYPGGLSGTVRAVYAARGQNGPASAAARAGTAANVPDDNVQMNDDSYPPMPQNETAVAYNVTNPKIAVAAANDYVSGGVVVMRTSDSGRHWSSTRVSPQFRGTGDFCTGGDPGVAYSRRDNAFYISQLCFFRALPFSEVQVYKSVDDGATWTPGRQAARAASNFDYSTGTVDPSIFNDKELIAVDNNPSSTHYGRVYVTYTKFHLQPNGFSDYCPIQLSYTDSIPTNNPVLSTWSHTAVQPDNPGGDGTGSSADQFSDPVVERDGTLDIGFVSEDCNDSYDPHLLFQRSTDGGQTFLPSAVQIDKAGQYADFLDAGLDDTLPPTHFRAPNTPSLAYSPQTGKLLFVYQNNVNRPTSQADISYQTSADGGLHWSDAAFLSTDSSGQPAVNDQFFPWAASDENGRFYVIWFDSGAFIGDYNGLAASTDAVYAVWTDGRDDAIGQTGLGETDIFTKFQKNP